VAPPATRANQVWAYDFVFDTCANGQPLKCLTVIDEWTRECLAIDVAGGILRLRLFHPLAQGRGDQVEVWRATAVTLLPSSSTSARPAA
jgi:transposase InsO family protein